MKIDVLLDYINHSSYSQVQKKTFAQNRISLYQLASETPRMATTFKNQTAFLPASAHSRLRPRFGNLAFGHSCKLINSGRLESSLFCSRSYGGQVDPVSPSPVREIYHHGRLSDNASPSIAIVSNDKVSSHLEPKKLERII